MNESLLKIAEGLVANGLRGRDELINADVRRREAEAKRRDEHKLMYYAQDQERALINELNERANILWRAYVRVVSEAGIAWTDDTRELIEARVAELTERDGRRLDDLAREL